MPEPIRPLCWATIQLAMNNPLLTSPQTLDDWLAHCEQLHPIAIDMGLERVRTVARRMGVRFDCPVDRKSVV